MQTYSLTHSLTHALFSFSSRPLCYAQTLTHSLTSSHTLVSTCVRFFVNLVSTIDNVYREPKHSTSSNYHIQERRNECRVESNLAYPSVTNTHSATCPV
jgi:hypothetical protein